MTETVREMVARWIHEQPDKPRFTLTRHMIEELLRVEQPVPRCDACETPNNPDGTCSRRQCYNND